MSKAGSIFDEGIVKDAILLGFATSRRVGDDAVNKIIRSLETYTTRKVNIVTYERARPDNSLKREAPEEYIELQVRGLVFNIWSSRQLTSQEALEQVDEEEIDLNNDDFGRHELFVAF